MDLWLCKFICIIICAVTISTCGLLPIKTSSWFSKKGERGKQVLSLFTCFGGGVFFGTYLLLMTPEVRDIIERVLLQPQSIHYPIPELLTGLGFFLILYIDKLANLVVRNRKQQDKAPQLTLLSVCSVKHTHSFAGHHDCPRTPNACADVIATVDRTSAVHGEVPVDLRLPGSSSVILLVAMCLDCVFGGISLGLQPTGVATWSLLIALLSHELIIAFSLGLRFVAMFSHRRVLLLIIPYALTTSAGIAIGTALYETSGNSPTVELVSAVCQCIACGIFIYTTFMEILSDEMTHESGFGHVFALTSGFAFMAVLQALEPLFGRPVHDDKASEYVFGNSTLVLAV